VSLGGPKGRGSATECANHAAPLEAVLGVCEPQPDWIRRTTVDLRKHNRCYTFGHAMPSQKRQTAFRIEPEILEGLHEVKTRDGLPISEQVRRALREWLQRRGVKLREVRPRAVTRKRSSV
jgi:hypothetical protein